MGGVVSECHGEWNCSPKWGFVFSLSPRVLLVLLREERIVSLVPQTRPEPTLLKVHQLCDGLFLPAWGMCVRKSVGKSVPWLCASPESATFGSPAGQHSPPDPLKTVFLPSLLLSPHTWKQEMGSAAANRS